MKKKVSAILAALVSSGCASTASVIGPPPERCMKKPASIASYKTGDNIMDRHGKLIVGYKREASKLRCLQRYADIVSKGGK